MSSNQTAMLDGKKELNLTARFSLAGMLMGFVVGICEGSFILLRQRHIRLSDTAVGPAILLLAPLVDTLGYGLIGGILGSIAALVRRRFPGRTAHFAAVGLTILGAQLIYKPTHTWVRIGNYPSLVDAGIALVGGLSLALSAVRYGPIIWTRVTTQRVRIWPPLRPVVRRGALFAGTVLVGLLTVAMLIMSPPDARLPPPSNGAGSNRPNIVLIALDTARADHFSSYGYSKPTTPNLDSLASQGVLFENAVASAPWTLPSFASVFTGLLPHQDRTNWETPLPQGISTLASILSSRGYQTGGFNANNSAGTARTGLAQGFDFYDDNDRSVRADFANIGWVMAFWRLVYYPFFRADHLPRQDARALNQDVFHWLRARDSRPAYLFVNYFDVHEPYDTIPEVGNRFGNARKTLAQRISAEVHNLTLEIEVPRTQAEQAALIAGYDSGLAYADRQIGILLQRLKSSPEWSNTYVIVFGDHGQAFGSHRHYGHGWGLNWELLHVPLIVAGPGIPPGRRVKDLVGLQQIFSTVLDLSGGAGNAPERRSLRCYWTFAPSTCDPAPMVISELIGWEPTLGGSTSSISAVTPDRHFIRDAAGTLQLYDIAADAGEEANLAGSPEHRDELAALQRRLFEQVQTSSLPWLGEEYLWALGERQFSLLAAQHRVQAKWPALKLQQPSVQDNELLHSLPYQ